MIIQRILVPVDFSDMTPLLVARAEGLARQLGARISLLHDIELPADADRRSTVRVSPDGPEVNVLDAERVKAEAQLQPYVEALGDLLEGVILREGDADDVILSVAAEERFDLIFIGTEGRTGLRRLLLGNVAEKVIRSAPCPVMVIRAPDQ